MNLEDYPIIVLEDLESKLSTIRKLSDESLSKIYEKKESKDILIKIVSSKLKKFQFKIQAVGLTSDNTIRYLCFMSPYREHNNKLIRFSSSSNQVLEEFQKWLKLIERYDNVSFDDPIIKQYQEEIFNEIKILDDNADTIPFNIKQQTAILCYLDQISLITTPNEDLKFLTEKIEETKTEITSLSKNQVMKRLSKILAYSRKSSLGLYKSFFDVFKKEMIKEFIGYGSERIQELIMHLS